MTTQKFGNLPFFNNCTVICLKCRIKYRMEQSVESDAMTIMLGITEFLVLNVLAVLINTNVMVFRIIMPNVNQDVNEVIHLMRILNEFFRSYQCYLLAAHYHVSASLVVSSMKGLYFRDRHKATCL
jgi:hypothetical protein